MEIDNNFSGMQSKQSGIGSMISGKASADRSNMMGIEGGLYNNTPKYLGVHQTI
jgi:hypothetical protein